MAINSAHKLQKNFRVIIKRGEDGTFVAKVPELPGCVSDGKTKKEALKNIKGAIEGYFETLCREVWSLPRVIGRETMTRNVKS